MADLLTSRLHPDVVEPAWAVLMRVPSWSLRVSSLQRPEAVAWRRSRLIQPRPPGPP